MWPVPGMTSPYPWTVAKKMLSASASPSQGFHTGNAWRPSEKGVEKADGGKVKKTAKAYKGDEEKGCEAIKN